MGWLIDLAHDAEPFAFGVLHAEDAQQLASSVLLDHFEIKPIALHFIDEDFNDPLGGL